jgi:transcriptional regulator with XRE-family HTH domain
VREHGTYTCYRWGPEPGEDWHRGCRCEACRQAAATYNKILERRRLKGIETLFDNSEAREHLRWLSGKGVGLRTVQERSGVGRTTLQSILSGRARRSRAETIAAILAVGTHVRAPGGLVDAGPTWQLLEDMLRYGYTQGYLAKRLGAVYEKPILQISRSMVLQSTADKVAELHAVLVGTERERHRVRQAEFRRRKAQGAA